MKFSTSVRIGLAAFALAGLLGLLTGGVAFAAPTGGVGGRPANPDLRNPRTESIFIYTLNKGQEKADQVLLSNTSDKKQTVELYAVDGIVTNTGAYTCDQKAEVSTGMGNWIAIDQTQVTLEANQSVKVGFHVAMPQTADVGEHDGCLVFQAVEDEGVVEGNVRIRTRQAIRVIATVPGELKRAVAIDKFEVTRADGLEHLQLTVGNTGNVSADITTQISLTSLFGKQLYANGGGYPVLSGKQLSLDFASGEKPFFGGWYRANASVSYDMRADTFGVSDRAHLKTEHARTVTIFIAPQPLALLLYVALVTLLVGVCIGLVLRRRTYLKTKKSWSRYTVRSGDTIDSLAAERTESWKRIARSNNLKPPYTLVAGDVIQLPAASNKAAAGARKGH